MPSQFTNSSFAIRNFGDLINLMDSFQAGGRKSILIKFWPWFILDRLGTVNKAFNVT